MVHKAIDFVIDLQVGYGEIYWARSEAGPLQEALLTGCASVFHSIRCALALAALVGEPQPEWELALGRLGHAIAAHPEAFTEKDRYSMDWYYPILGSALRGPAAAARIEQRWDDFVVGGLGIRCVVDRPWVTGAETCELVMALDAIGQRSAAHRQFGAMQHLRAGGRLLLDRGGVRGRQTVARGAHHVDGSGDDPRRGRAVEHHPGAEFSAVRDCRWACRRTSTANASGPGRVGDVIPARSTRRADR